MSIRGSKRSPDLLLTSGNTRRSSVSFPTSVSSTFRAQEHTLKRLRKSSILRSRCRSNRTSPGTSSGTSEHAAFGTVRSSGHSARATCCSLTKRSAGLPAIASKRSSKAGRPDALPRPSSAPSFRRRCRTGRCTSKPIWFRSSRIFGLRTTNQGERGRKEGVQRAVLFGRHPENTGSRGKPNRCKGGGEEKRRGQNTELGGSDPTFRPCGLESDPWGRSRPAAQKTTPPVLAPSPQGEEKRRELEERKEKASAKRCETASHLEEESPSRTRRQRTARRLCRVHRNQCGGCAEYRAEKDDRQ